MWVLSGYRIIMLVVISFDRFSSFSKIRRVLAYVYRFINNCRVKNNRSYGVFSVDELQNAELKLAWLSQIETYDKYKNNFKNVPFLSNLTPIVDDKGLIRVGGRLENSQFNFNKKHPIFLDSKHHFTVLLFMFFHFKLLHAGPQLLLSVIKESYWPVGGRTLARQVYKKCLTCLRLRGVVAKQIMGNLPSERLSPGFPFEVTGTDFAGPFLL